jgi:hypothetical protein
MNKDVKIIQDTRILQNIIGRFPDHGNQINVFYITNVSENDSVPVMENAAIAVTPAIDHESYIENLPQPRLKNLIKRAVAIAMTRFGSDTEAGRWLGGSRRLIGYRRETIPREEETEDEEIG